MINLGISYNEVKANILAGEDVWIHCLTENTEGIEEEAITYTNEMWTKVLSFGASSEDGEATFYSVWVFFGNSMKLFGAVDPDADLTDDESGGQPSPK